MGGETLRHGFLIMPFDLQFDWLQDLIVSAGAAEDVLIQRGDDIFAPGVVLEQIFYAIDRVEIVIAVCTGKNANVFFELGYAWRDHSPILIAESAADLPFNIQHYRTELYGGGQPELNRATIRGRIRSAIRSSIDERKIPRGHRLSVPPARKASARLSGQLISSGSRGSKRFVVSNTGTVNINDVDVKLPPEASSFSVISDELPIKLLRPGEQASLLASVSMMGGRRIFDVSLTGRLEDGDEVEFPTKISL